MMKNTLLALAITTASAGAFAELSPMTDTDLGEATGQSGILVGITIGSVDDTDVLNVDYSNAGFKMDAFKWEVDAQAGTANGANVELPGALSVNAAGDMLDAQGNVTTDPTEQATVYLKPTADPAVFVDGNGTSYPATAIIAGPSTVHGGILVSGIKVGGGLDLVIDAVAGGGTQGDINGLGISFQNSNINIRMDSINTYSQFDKAPHSLGSFEMIGMNLDGTTITISGN